MTDDELRRKYPMAPGEDDVTYGRRLRVIALEEENKILQRQGLVRTDKGILTTLPPIGSDPIASAAKVVAGKGVNTWDTDSIAAAYKGGGSPPRIW